MIKFSCPLCKARLEYPTPDERIACPSCGQRLRVPTPPLQSIPFKPPPVASKPTVLGEHLPDHRGGQPLVPADSSKPAVARSDSLPDAQRDKPLSLSLFRDPVQLSFVVAGVIALFLLVNLLLLVLCLWINTTRGWIWGLLLIAATTTLAVFLAAIFRTLLLAKSKAISGEPVTLLFGLGKLIVWEQNQGLILLKDKRIRQIVYGPQMGGGLLVIYPFLGEECKARVPLTLRLSHFMDHNILTRESVRLFVKVALWWKVVDLEKYYYVISHEIHVVTNEGYEGYEVNRIQKVDGNTKEPKQDAAERWILTLAESCLRKLISQTGTAFIISKTAANYLHAGAALPQVGAPTSSPPSAAASNLGPATPDVLAQELWTILNPKAKDYSLEVDRVEIQEVRLPPDIQQAVDEVWIASTKPARSEYEARAQQIALKASADVLGVDAVALVETMKSCQGMNFIGGMPQFLEFLFGRLNPSGAKMLSSAPQTGGPPQLPGGAEQRILASRRQCKAKRRTKGR
jgi:regulator of protease activity HflC (stomatin/prohibitin superfamily)